MERRWNVRGFEWDGVNEEHVARHGVRPQEAEEIFLGRLHLMRGRRGRYVVFGRTGAGRGLLLVVTRRENGRVRVIKARDMTDRERRLLQRRGK